MALIKDPFLAMMCLMFHPHMNIKKVWMTSNYNIYEDDDDTRDQIFDISEDNSVDDTL